MSALHPVMAAAIAPFAAPVPKTTSVTIDHLRQLLSEADARWNSLLRLPFEAEVQTEPAVRSWGPLGREAEYALVRIDDDLVAEAADTILDRHMREWEAESIRLQRMRWDAQREDV